MNRRALRRLAVPPEERKRAVMVGDRKHDIAGAKACGISSLGVSFGYGEPGELQAAGADITVETVEELERFLLENVE